MSTKIYNAYVYNGSLDELMCDIKKMRKNYREDITKMIVNQKVTCEILKIVAKGLYCDFLRKYNITDTVDADKDPVQNIEIRNLNYSAMIYFFEAMMKSGINDPYNVDESVVIYPYKNKLYVQFFGYKLDTRKYKKFKDFHYQNQCDKDAGISNKEWKIREAIWEDLMSESGVPSVCGLSYEFGELPKPKGLGLPVS